MKPDKDTFEAWNEQHAIKHDLDKFYNHPNRLFRYIENKRIDILLKFAEISENDKVLEVGCGIGHILERIHKGKLTGIDISETQINRARERLSNKAELLKCAGENLPFADKHFDRIICTEVFEHTLEPVKVLDEMNRTLKDDGIISLSVPNERLITFTKKFLLSFGFRRILEPKESRWDLASRNNLEEWHLHEYGLKRILNETKNKFKVLHIARIPFYFIPFRFVLQLKKIN
jgi:ubiquinone/menaquinone biosynthesis C-methylase UbiE